MTLSSPEVPTAGCGQPFFWEETHPFLDVLLPWGLPSPSRQARGLPLSLHSVPTGTGVTVAQQTG